MRHLKQIASLRTRLLYRRVRVGKSAYDAVSLTVNAIRELKLQIQNNPARLGGGDNCFGGEQ